MGENNIHKFRQWENKGREASQVQSTVVYFSCVSELTSPADPLAETALRQNSSTIREETLEPTRDSRIASNQNWRVVFQLTLTREDDLVLVLVLVLSLSRLQEKESLVYH